MFSTSREGRRGDIAVRNASGMYGVKSYTTGLRKKSASRFNPSCRMLFSVLGDPVGSSRSSSASATSSSSPSSARPSVRASRAACAPARRSITTSRRDGQRVTTREPRCLRTSPSNVKNPTCCFSVTSSGTGRTTNAPLSTSIDRPFLIGCSMRSTSNVNSSLEHPAREDRTAARLSAPRVRPLLSSITPYSRRMTTPTTSGRSSSPNSAKSSCVSWSRHFVSSRSSRRESSCRTSRGDLYVSRHDSASLCRARSGCASSET